MYKIIDLFCGIGGFSYGFEMTNRFKTMLGVDFWDVALNTFKKNHPSTEVKQGDIRELDEKFFEKYIGKTDVVIAGPPCQGFSMAGRRDVLDERNNLFKEVIRIVEIVKPKVVVIENVLGLLSMTIPSGENVKDVIVSELKELGYYVDVNVLTASEYGIPQNRKRVIFIASLVDNVKFPQPQYGNGKKPVITVGDALGNIPKDGSDYLEPKNEYQTLMAGRKAILNHEPIKHAPLIVKRMHSVPQGGNWQDIPIGLGQGGGKHSNNYRRLKMDEPSITIKHVSKSMIIHPIYDRTPTVREVARIQSFNDDFELTGTKYDQHQQLANAVPPILGKSIADAVLEMLRDYKCLK
ncbi:DNA (cytosine-5)-methyltransferase 1 [Natranaerovirga pectinivora]|uniref:Cytosine-specific methyltransferase n=1 Tax=Natranaerovirga pectinivora TaxID=682400 RepID=A0A4R3MN94_9FIRM|nr:DNA cytosine methyltransferase [Natranaerovirga pectinivora]TCT15504.1 DNA (cytosine-5)-methyltransferase 1 [Natranaerovirga pectinivora]